METNSSFFRAVAELFNIKSECEKEELGFNIPLASCQKASKTVVLFENTKDALNLDGSVSPQKDPLITRQCFQYLGTVLVQHLIDTNRAVPFL